MTNSIDDALALVTAVRDKFQDKNRENYHSFLQVLSDFKAERIDRRVVKLKVYELFKGHQDLMLRFNTFMPTQYEIKLPLDDDEQQGRQLETKDALAFLKKVRDVFQGTNREKYDELLNILKDFNAQRIDASGVAERVTELFQGHTNLILGFNVFLPKKYQITPKLQLDTGEKMNKVAKSWEVPWDLLDMVSRTLDFDDLFQFAGVCKSWREFHKIYWGIFLAAQEPLLVQKSSDDKKFFSLISIPDQRVYHSKMIDHFWHLAYSGCSSGYLIMTSQDNSFVLLNPFTRRKKVINTSAFQVNFSYFAYHVLLAFGKGTEEFVLVALCKCSGSLNVYQSRNSDWVTYSTIGNPGKVVDFVVLHNTIYVVTDKATIGVLDLNSANINFLELKSTPVVTSSSHLRLVSCDGQLLVIHITSDEILNVYKIDFSTKNFVKLETLGDIALFYASGEYFYALSNPRRWGYESNSLHVINLSSTKCIVCLGDENKLPEYISHDIIQVPPIKRRYLLDWCFRHLHNEVDYSLVE